VFAGRPEATGTSRRHTVLAALAVIGIAFMILVAPTRVHVSEAAWADGEFSHGTFTAIVIQPPVIATCVLSPGLLGANPVVTITWRFPSGSTYSTPANVIYFVAQGGLLGTLTSVLLGTSLTTTGPVAGVYTTQFKSGILGGLLGGSYGLFLQTKDGSGWTSTLASATASMGLLGANPQCVITPV
jgi:hypothetical protein